MRTWIGAAACAAVFTIFATASAQDASRAHLVTAPDAVSLSDHFPAVALARGESGRAVLSCAVAVDGSSQCTAAEETPANAGFGAAAASLAQGWRFTPRLENGQAVASTVRVPVVFQNPSPATAPIAPDINVDAARGAASLAANPSGDLSRFYPARARQAGANGRVLVACAVRTGPRLECAPEREAPTGWGFDQAAVAVAAEVIGHQRLRPGDRTRVAVDFGIRYGSQASAPRTFWDSQPTGDDYLRYYPGRALDSQRGGSALLNCVIQADRTLACSLASETPRGWGFGDAAVQLSRRYRLATSEVGRPGHSVGDQIIFPVVFGLPH